MVVGGVVLAGGVVVGGSSPEVPAGPPEVVAGAGGGGVESLLLHAGSSGQRNQEPKRRDRRDEKGPLHEGQVCRLMRASDLVNWTIRVTLERSSRKPAKSRARAASKMLERVLRDAAPDERSRAGRERSPAGRG